MENASKALIIAGAILLSILLIAIGMYIFNSSQNAIAGGADAISQHERDAFNAIWEQYEGNYPGSNVKTVISKLITNANSYREEATKLPTLIYTATSTGAEETVEGGEAAIGDANVDTYIPGLNAARTAIENRHTYTIELTYSGTSSLVETITVLY